MENFVNKYIEQVKTYLINKYDPRVIILYGSFSSGSMNEYSDVDILCFADIKEEKHDSEKIGEHLLDAWLKSMDKFKASDDFLYILPCSIIHEKDINADSFIKELIQIKEAKTISLSEDERLHFNSWINKMINRSLLDDEEGNYRYNWLLHDFPELYSKYLCRYYDGPKKTIHYMKMNDNIVFNEYSLLLKSLKSVESIKKIYDIIQNR